MDQWMVQNEDSPVVGPVATKVLFAGIRAGRVPDGARIRREVDQDWTVLATSRAFADAWAREARRPLVTTLAAAASVLLAATVGLVVHTRARGAELSEWVLKSNAPETRADLLATKVVALEARVRELEQTEDGMLIAISAAADVAERTRTVAAFAAAIAACERFVKRWPESARASKVRDRQTDLTHARDALAAKTPTAIGFDELHKLAATGMLVGKPYAVCAWYYVNGLSQLCATEHTCLDKQVSLESDFAVGTDESVRLYDRRGKHGCFEVKMFPSGGLFITGLR